MMRRLHSGPGRHTPAELCEAFDVSRSGCHAPLRKAEGARRREDRALRPQVIRAFSEGRETDGTPRLRKALRRSGARPTRSGLRAQPHGHDCLQRPRLSIHLRRPGCRRRPELLQTGQSTGRKGNCSDSAAMESFRAPLETEAFTAEPATRAEARFLIHDHIDAFHSTRRLHSPLNGMSPLDFEHSLLQTLN